ncbi:MAG: hypothetical protein JW822_02355 [Spirochaetales bacterium]|nr:hypothetical protein [Spirochaetales bacterium]
MECPFCKQQTPSVLNICKNCGKDLTQYHEIREKEVQAKGRKEALLTTVKFALIAGCADAVFIIGAIAAGKFVSKVFLAVPLVLLLAVWITTNIIISKKLLWIDLRILFNAVQFLTMTILGGILLFIMVMVFRSMQIPLF